ncbi:MAG: hypothetical protein JXR96_07710 [Deltaproteobacteria bacterium]|nr:hypothetical protein [Deltaproteobacteria bacterium]
MSRPSPMLLALALLGFSSPARAHAPYQPLSTNRYTVISFEGGRLHVDYAVTAGDLPAQRLRQRFDADGSGVLDESERERALSWFRARIADGLALTLDARPVRPDIAIEAEWLSDQVELFAPLRLRARFQVDLSEGAHRLVYADRVELPELEQTEIFIRPAAHVRLQPIAIPAGAEGAGNRFQWLRGRRPEPVEIGFALVSPGRGGQATATSPALADETGALKRALAERDLGWAGLLAALGLAWLLGALHALSPGHGKTLVAAYLVGSRGTVRHAIALGAVVTASHVLTVFALGLAALWASAYVLPERLTPWISAASGALVAGLGCWMLVQRLHGRAHGHHHEHGPGAIRAGELLALGISGGLVPCPSALVVLLAAIYLGRIGLGLGLLAAFSLGLACTLIAIGLIVVRGRNLLERWTKNARIAKLAAALPVASAVLITVIGLAMCAAAVAEL